MLRRWRWLVVVPTFVAIMDMLFSDGTLVLAVTIPVRDRARIQQAYKYMQDYQLQRTDRGRA